MKTCIIVGAGGRGKDAYAPILAASGNKKAYLKALKKKFEFEANVL